MVSKHDIYHAPDPERPTPLITGGGGLPRATTRRPFTDIRPRGRRQYTPPIGEGRGTHAEVRQPRARALSPPAGSRNRLPATSPRSGLSSWKDERWHT